MEKMKLLTVFLLCLGIAGIAWSAEVISIDLNGDGSAAYTGDGAYTDGDVVWRAYYQGTGKPMGSFRSANLPDYNEPDKPATYAAGVWITDNVANHTYVTGSGQLMDDGFDKNGAQDPCLVLFAFPDTTVDPCSSDGRAFGGTYDIYVYGREAGNITLSTPNTYGPCTLPLTGGYVGTFTKGMNYEVFYDVLIDDGNAVTISYTNQINGIQLVSTREPITVSGSFVIEAENWDVAYETNLRPDANEIHDFGPDIGVYTLETPDAIGIGYLDTGESMIYDITVETEGEYEITGFIRTASGDCDNLELYLDDDIYLGKLAQLNPDDSNYFELTDQPAVKVNLFEGPHTLKWVVGGPQIYYDIDKLYVDRIPNSDPNFDDCNEVKQYNLGYENDFDGDCDVDVDDLVYIIGSNSWLECFDPDPNGCL